MYEVNLTPQAERAYLHLDEKTQKRIDRVFERFERGEFQHHNIRALHGRFSGSLRYRLGLWRIVFRVDRPNRTIWIEAITTRGGAYQK